MDAQYSASFHLNHKLLGLGRQIGQKIVFAFGVFWVMLTSQISIWDWDLNLGRKKLEI